MLESEPALVQPASAAQRRRAPRRPKHLLVAPGVWLEDESREGAGFLTEREPPAPGAAFTYTVGSRVATGRVKWIRAADRGMSRFGVEKVAAAR